jgi:hypothetical protein
MLTSYSFSGSVKSMGFLMILLVFTHISVLRGSESAPAGIGNSTGTNGQPKLVMWLDATELGLTNGEKVSLLPDQSGHNNHATQPAAGNQPVFSIPASGEAFSAPSITFSRTQSQFLGFNGNMIAGTDYTFSFVGGRLTNNGFRVFAGGSAEGSNQNLHLYFKDSNALHHHHYSNDYNSPMVTTGHNGGTTVGTMGIFNVLLEQNAPSDRRRTYQNNDLRNTSNSNAALSSWEGAAFGRYRNGYHDIALSEAIVYANALNPAQIIILNNYLHQKYGIAIKDQKFSPISSLFTKDIIGIGTPDGISKHTASSNSGGGILLSEANNNFSLAGEKFVFSAHNGDLPGENILDLPSLGGDDALIARSNRSWYVQRSSSNTTEINMGFDLAQAGLGTGEQNQIFYLLHRENESGPFNIVPFGTSIAIDGIVWFKVDDGQLLNGFYTIARSNQTGKTWYSYKNGNWDDYRTWSLEQGGIDMFNPLQSTPTTSLTSHIDRVVINSGHKVIVSANDKKALALVVENGILDLGSTTGHRFESISGTPEGTIRLLADNFPQGNAQQFGSATGGNVEYYGAGYSLNQSHNFNNVIINLTTNNSVITLLTDYNLSGNLRIDRGIFRINNDSNTSILNLNIDGDLVVKRNGSITVGQGNTASDFSIPGKIPGRGMYYSIYHQVRVGGNLTNNGTIRFTNQNAPHYKQFTYTGAATVTFTAASNAMAELNGTTDFYNLIIDKGVDQTFELEVNSMQAENFRLYGPNNMGRTESAPFSGANPEVRKALWIKNGTLRLTGSIYIPSLTEGNVGGNGDYPIPANGALWIDGYDVKVFTTSHTSVDDNLPGTEGIENGSSNQALTVLGKYKITDGYFSTRNSAGFIFWATSYATVEILGGITDVSQFRSANNNLGRSTFAMTGGEIIVRGNLNNFDHNGQNIETAGGEVTGAYPIFGIIDPEGVFNMSGGIISVYRPSNNNSYNSNGILINSALNNHNVSNGTIRLIGYNQTVNYDVLTTGNLFNLELLQLPANSTQSTNVFMSSDLALEGSLSIGSRTNLIARKQHGHFNGRSNNLSVSRGFTIQSGGSYLPMDNTTTLYVSGTQNTQIYLPEINFFNLTIAPHPQTTPTLRNFNHTGQNTIIHVMNDFTVDAGARLRHHNQNFLVKGHIHNSGEIIHQNASSTGRVLITRRGIVSGTEITNAGSHTSIPTITLSAPQLAGGIQATALPVFDGIPAANNALPLVGIIITNTGSGYTTIPTITISSGGAAATASIKTNHLLNGNNEGIFSSLEINEPHPAASAKTVALKANFKVNNTMFLTDGILDLETFNLQINGKLSTKGQADEQNIYSETRMFRINGNHGDGGLTLKIDAAGTYLFPVGTYKASANSNRYAYAQPTFSNVITPGNLQINPVPAKLPTLTDDSNPNQRRYLRYYWRVRHTFNPSSLPQIQHTFRSYEGDYYAGNGSVNYTQMTIGKVVNNERHPKEGQDAGYLGTLLDLGSGSRLLNFSTLMPMESGEFTCGRRQMFDGTITVYYNRFIANAIWSNKNTWSTVGHTSSTNTANVPGIGDIVNLSNSGAANSNHYVTITSNLEVAKVNFNYTGTGWGPRLLLAPGVRANIDIVDGSGGQIGFQFNNNQGMSRLTGDLSGFNANYNTNQIIFFPLSDNANPVVLPDNIREYPSVRIHGNGGNNTAQRIVSFPEDIVIKGSLRIDVSSTLRVHDGPNGNITVMGNVMVGPDSRGGRLEFPTSGPAKKFVIHGNVNIGGIAGHAGIDSEIRVMNNTPSGILHHLEIHGNIVLSRNGKINLFTNNNTGNNVALKLAGEASSTFTITETTGSPYANFHSIEIDKGSSVESGFAFNSMFSLNGPTNGDSKALTLKNGFIDLNHSLIDITLSSGGSDFMIPANTGLLINRGTARITSTGSNGIMLDGLLEVNGPDSSNPGKLLLDGGAGSDNYIVYSSSGRAQISVTGGQLVVGSQIRGSLVNDSGILKYHQLNKSGYGTSQVIIGKNSAPATNRGVFEIHNEGSRFRFFSGTLSIIRGHETASERAALYLNPAVSGLNEWGSIVLGDGTNSSEITVNSVIELPTLTIKGNTTAKTQINNLVVFGNLTIENDAMFDGDNLNLKVRKNLTNNGEAVLNTDTLFLEATNEQWMRGSFVVNNMVVNPTTRTYLQSATNVHVQNNLLLKGGIFEDAGNHIIINGNLNNLATHISGTNGRLILRGTQNQYVSGNGRFGNLEIDNTAQIRIDSDLMLENNLILSVGILNIGTHRLNLAASSEIIGSDFSEMKMIATSGSIADKGIRRFVNAGEANLIFPMGVISGTINKYTPANIAISANSGAGYININPVNQLHMTATGEDVLQYYWIVESHGLNGLNAEMQLHYSDDDLRGNANNYYTARLVGDGWQKLPVGVDTSNNLIEFYFGSASNMNGDYTAGIDPDIPAQIPVFMSNGNGNWTQLDNWLPVGEGEVPTGGPNGHIVIIREGDHVDLDRFRVLAYRTEIYGTLNAGTESGHNLGRVSGNGTLNITDGKLPAGIYTSFMSAESNSTIEYDGAEGYIIPNLTSYGLSSNTYNNLVIKGGGEKILPNADITVRNNLDLLETATLESRAAQMIYIGGNLTKAPTAIMHVDYLAQKIIMNGTEMQYINGDFSGADNTFRNLQINNAQGVSLMSNADISESLQLTKGVMYTGNNILTVTRRASNAITAQAGTFVDGILRRDIAHNGTGYFPIGKSGIKRDVTLHEVSNGFWTTEYFDQDPADAYMPSDVMDGLALVGNKEYWRMEGPSAGQAKIQLSWGLESVMPEVEPEVIEQFIAVAQWDSNKWINKGNSAADAYGNGTGFVKAAGFSSFMAKSGEVFFTLGSSDSEQLPLPIELISFTAEMDGEAVLLKWITASEINNHFFTIERSRDGKEFEIVTVVASLAENGFSNDMLNYSTLDTQPLSGLTYYRLKQTDYDGSFAYSELITLNNEASGIMSFNLFPNPNTGNAFRVAMIGLKPYEPMELNIVDFYGKTVYTNRILSDDNGSMQAYVVPSGRFKSGVYMVTVSGDSGVHHSRMVVSY